MRLEFLISIGVLAAVTAGKAALLTVTGAGADAAALSPTRHAPASLGLRTFVPCAKVHFDLS